VPVGRESSRRRQQQQEYGDTAGAAAIVSAARAALASGDAFGHVRKVVRSEVAGWSEERLASHDPPHVHMTEPVHVTHAVATLGGLVFDAAEERALPLSRASLDRCVGMHLNGATFSRVARAVKPAVPGKSVRKRLAWRA